MSRRDFASPAAPDTTPGIGRAYPWVASLLAIWLLVWIGVSWPYSLDDALIHLRYADHLLHGHRITYDGVHASFGTSSLLYVSLLAGLRALTASPLLPRVVTSVVYVALFATLAVALYRGLQQADAPPAAVWLMAVALLAITVAPSAVRWLDDGMETGLVFLDALLGVLLLRTLTRSSRLPPRLLVYGFVYGLFTVLLRVELLMLVGCLSLMAGLHIFTGRVRRLAVEHPVRGLVAASMPALGGIAAAGLIVLTMGALLPDTALAKAFGAGAWQDTFQMTAVTVASSFSFGIGLLLLWLASLAALAAWDRIRLADLPGNLLFPLVLLASAVRGQQIQGIRYFGWTLFFPLLWNLLRVADGEGRSAPGFARGLQACLLLFLVALVPAFAWESRTFYRLFADRGAALNQFRAQERLVGLRGQLGIAEDVGFVGYFTQGDICDPYGLVNGRAAAKLKYAQRFDHCMAQHPVFAFGSREFLAKVTFQQSLAGWSVCGSYPFDNVRSRDVHYLAVAPAQSRAACPATAKPIAEVLPGLL